MTSKATASRIERAIRTLRQRIFSMPEARQVRATQAILTLKSRLVYEDTVSAYHWMYAAE